MNLEKQLLRVENLFRKWLYQEGYDVQEAERIVEKESPNFRAFFQSHPEFQDKLNDEYLDHVAYRIRQLNDDLNDPKNE